jgi:uncharacterized heparinase superfamily protein
MLKRIARELAFARHVPPRQLARRAALVVRRKAEARLRPALDAGDLRSAERPPLPLFAPRRGMAQRTADGWRLRFIGRTEEMPHTIEWKRSPDQLWRMNLHYMEYLEELADSDVEALIRQWTAANPPYARGSASDSWNAYAVSLRSVVWIQQLALRRERLDSAFLAEAEKSLAGQLRYLERHLETDVGGNHLIKNVKALAWASAYFDGAAAKRWRRKALRLLARELPLQILPDGMHFELSPAYHCQVLADLIEIRHALGSDPLNGALDEAIARAARAAADLAHPDGRIAQFGDAGLAMAYTPAECLAALGLEPEQHAVFTLGGYHGCRDRDCYFIADAGRIAPDQLPAHGHGDIGSFEWSVAGQRLVVDQGVYEYVAGPKRSASRSARSHNTLSVEGCDQAQFFGAFRVGARAGVTVTETSALEAGFGLEVRHDGFRHTGGGPIHLRRLQATPRHILIEDRLEGPPTTARVAILLHPDAAVQQIGASQMRVTCGKAAALVTGSAGLKTEAAVWWPDMGVECATVRIVMELQPGESAGRIELAAEAPDGR